MDEAGFFKGAVLAECAVDVTAETGAAVGGCDVACEMGLVEEGGDSVAFLEA